MSDVDTCVLVDVLLPEEALRIERMRTLFKAIVQDDGYLCHVLVRDASWLPVVLDDFRLMGAMCWPQLHVPESDSPAEKLEFLGQLKTLVPQSRLKFRRMREAFLHSRKGQRERVRDVARRLEAAERVGVAICKHVPEIVEQLVRCPHCSKSFANKGAMCSHLSRTHGIGSVVSRVAQGTVCQVCLVDHQSTKRLRAHLYNKQPCLSAYIAADISHDVVQVAGTSHAWVPPLQIEGPVPFWATLSPGEPVDEGGSSIRAIDMVRGYVVQASQQLAGRELSSFYHKLSRGLNCPGFGPSIAKDAAEQLPVDTSGLHEVLDLIEVFQRTREYQSGSFHGVRLKAQWNSRRVLLGGKQLDFSDALLSM